MPETVPVGHVKLSEVVHVSQAYEILPVCNVISSEDVPVSHDQITPVFQVTSTKDVPFSMSSYIAC